MPASGTLICFWRSLLFVPGNRPERFDKAMASGADAVCMDLEDAVPAVDKPSARQAVVSALGERGEAEHPALVVRLNAADTPQHADDVAALGQLPAKVLWMLPKASRQATENLSSAAADRKLIALLEDAPAIEQAYDIAALPAVAGLMLGGADLAANLGAQMSWDALLYARSRLLMASASAGAIAIDVPCLELRQAEVVREETQRIRALGFDCKAAIHPAQIEPIHRAMTPSAEEVERAQRMLATAEVADGGAVEFEGTMLDEAVLASARRILLLAEQAASE